MNFHLENRDNIVVFKILDNSIEGKAAADLKAKILVVAQSDIDALLIDLSNVAVMDSSGLGALLLAHRQLKEHNLPVVLIGVQTFLKSLLNITRIEDIFSYYETVEEAIANLKNKNA